jgi:hypothetical protein
MSELSVLEGIVPSSTVYGFIDESDVEYRVKKYKEDGDNIYYNCLIREWYSREFEFIYNKERKEIEIINQVSEKYPIFRRMALEYTNEIYNIVSDIYIIEEDDKKWVYDLENFSDPYFRFSVTKNGISVGVLMDYIFREKNGINIKVKMPKNYVVTD